MDRRTALDIVKLLDLRPHPEGGFFRETFRDSVAVSVDGGRRAASTAIYYLLRRGERSHWHRADATEVWHWYAGSPLRLEIVSKSGERRADTLGVAFESGEQPQAVVPASEWQSAETLGDWTLIGCTVAPGFEFSGFELAPPGWTPESEARGKPVAGAESS